MNFFSNIVHFFLRTPLPENDLSRKRRGEDIVGVPDNKLRCVEGPQYNGALLNHDVNRTKDKTNRFLSPRIREQDVFIGSWDQNGKENCSNFQPVLLNHNMEPNHDVDEVQILEEHNCKAWKKSQRHSNTPYNVACTKDQNRGAEFTTPQSPCSTKDVEVVKILQSSQSNNIDGKFAKERTSVSRELGYRNSPSQRRPFKTVDPSSSAQASSTPILFTGRRTLVHSPEQPDIEVLPSTSLANRISSYHHRNHSSSLFNDSSNIQRNSNSSTLFHMKKVEEEVVYDTIFKTCFGVERPFKVNRPKSPDEVVVLDPPVSPRVRNSSYRSPLPSRHLKMSPATDFRGKRITVPVEIKESEPSTSASRQVDDQELQIIGQVHAVESVKSTDPDVLTEILEKYNAMEKKMEDVKAIEKTTRLISERNRKAEEQRKHQIDADLIDQITSYLHIVEEIPIPEEEEIPSLPVLTEDMETEIDKALGAHPDAVLANAFNLTIKGRDMRTLKPLAWLNDEVINFYMNLLIERGKLENYPSIHAFNTFFFPKLSTSGYDSLKRWTKKVDIFSHDYILVPIHRGMHWCMAIIDMKEKVIRYYDSMDGRFPQCADALLNYLQKESMDKKKQQFDTSGWVKEHAEKIPQQNNGSDCGMFACMFAEYVSRDAPITFTQEDMPYFRRKVVYEILKAKLLT